MCAVSKMDLIKDVKRVADELEKTPTIREYNKHGDYSSNPVYKRFESWNDLLQQAKLGMNKKGKVTKKDLVEDYRNVAEKMGKRPTRDEYDERGKYSSGPVYNRFGSFNDLKEASGFGANEYRISSDKLKDDLLRVADIVEGPPTVEDYWEHGNHNHKTLESRFGAWKVVLQQAGLPPTEHSKHFEQSGDPMANDKRDNLVSVQCSFCEEETLKRPNQVRRFEKHYCSKTCKNEAASEQTGQDSHAWEGGETQVECEYCGETYKVTPSETAYSRFCSKNCLYKWREKTNDSAGENSPRWRGGYEPYYGPNWRKQRRRARDRDNHTCQSCGMELDEHKELWGCDLDVHHIDRFGSFDGHRQANKLSNLITLCKKCHTTVEEGKTECPTPASGD